MTGWVFLFTQPTILDNILKYSKCLFLIKGLKNTNKSLYDLIPEYPHKVSSIEFLNDSMLCDDAEMFDKARHHHHTTAIIHVIRKFLDLSMEIPNVMSRCTFIDRYMLGQLTVSAMDNRRYKTFLVVCELYRSICGCLLCSKLMTRPLYNRLRQLDLYGISLLFANMEKGDIVTYCLMYSCLYCSDKVICTFVIQELMKIPDDVLIMSLMIMHYGQTEDIKARVRDILSFSIVHSIDAQILIDRLFKICDFNIFKEL
jgi:hypothetical protein